MTKKKDIGKHISLDIKSRNNLVEGLVLDKSDSWILLINNVVDYVCDGFLLVNCLFVKNQKSDADNKWTEKIILLKNKNIKPPKIKLADTKSVFNSLKSLNKVIAISNKKGDITWVGKILDVLDESVTIKTLTPKAKWADNKIVLFKDLTVIDFDTDYINSLLLLADK